VTEAGVPSAKTGVTDETPSWSLRLAAEFHAADERAIALARMLSADQVNWKPRPGEWSIGQCLAHLSAGNELYLDAISASLEDHPRMVVGQITPGRLSQWFIERYVAPPSPQMKRATAPGKIAPAPWIDPTILDRFLQTNQRAREVIREASDCDVNRIRFRNPFVPLVRFTVGTGLEILSQHERRHLLQAERVRASAGFPPV
jgi:hypothetical protein